MARPFAQCFGITVCVLFTGVSLLWVFKDPNQKSHAKLSPPLERRAEESVADQIRALQEEFVEKQQELSRGNQTEGDIEKRQELDRKYQELRSEVIAKFAKIVEKHPSDEAVFPALRWMISSPEHAAKAIDVLIIHHLNHEDLGAICFRLATQNAPGAERLAQAVARMSKSAEAKTLALLGLGQMLVSRSNEAGVGADKRKTDRKEAEAALNEALEECPDVDVFGRRASDWASAALFELHHLAVGQIVPELTGEDLDGSRFKLGDFRGKVVLLHFWAHWSAQCIGMFPHQRSPMKRFAGRPFALVGVNGDESDADMEQMNKEQQVSWRSFKNQRGEGRKSIADEWNVQRWPTLYLIDHNGIIRRRWLASPGDEVLDSEIKAIVEEAEAAVEK